MKLTAAAQAEGAQMVRSFLSLALVFIIHFGFGQSYMYGTTETGGDFGAGAIFRTDEDGANLEEVYSFPIQNEGGNPRSGLLLHSNGFYYGVTEKGGSFDEGVFYRYDRTTNTILKLREFDFGLPYGGLIEASNGKIYGTTILSSNIGSVFEFDPTSGAFTETAFSSTAVGRAPQGKLLEASNGLLYGLSNSGSSFGTIFSYDIATQTLSNVFTFSAAVGTRPNGALIQAADGKLYGTTTRGGANDQGTLFSWDITNSTHTKIIDFGSGNGTQPNCDLVQLGSGLMYGVTLAGGANGRGTVFKFDPVLGTLTTLHNFVSGTTGEQPYRGMTLASDGRLYGHTFAGGVGSLGGTLFALDPVTEMVSVLHSFTDGIHPYSLLTEGPTDILIGTTYRGGLGDEGVIFEYDLVNSTYTKKLDFGIAPEGKSSIAPLVASNGKLYSSNPYGGANSHGTLYEFDPADNSVSVLHHFDGTDGSIPIGELMIASDGKLYGLTNEGGTSDKGVIFSYDFVGGTFADLGSLGVAGLNGQKPQQGFVEAPNGKLYATTRFGGSAGRGTIFEVDIQNGIASSIYSFNLDGYGPRSRLIVGANGKLYGTAEDGGANNRGVLFSYDLTNSTYAIETPFGSGNGGDPIGGLLLAQNGLMYGATHGGGATGIGVVYSFDPSTSGSALILALTTGIGGNPMARLQESPNGKIYGVTRSYAANDIGSVIELDPVNNTVTKKVDMVDSIGRSRPGTLQPFCLTPVPDPTLQSTYVACNGDAFALNIGAANATSYVWKKDNVVDPNLTGDGLSIGALTAGDAGAYEIEVTNECGTTLVNFQLNVTILTTAVNTTLATCETTNDGSISVPSVTGGTAPYEYSLDGVTYSSSNTFSGLSSGMYDLYVRENGGCVSVESVELATQMTATATTTDVICNGLSDGTISMNPSGGATPYEFSIDGANFQSASIFNVAAGTYAVTTRDTNGCTVTTSVTVAEPSAIAMNVVKQDILCNGESTGSIEITASGGTGALQYSIDGTNFQSGNSFTGLTAGSYTVYTQDANFCQETQSVEVTAPDALSASEAISNVSCSGESDGSILLTPTGGVAPYSFTIDGDPNPDGLFDNLAAGTYLLAITDANGCSISGSSTVSQPVALSGGLSKTDPTTCSAADGTVTVTVNGGTAPYMYQLDGAAAQSSNVFTDLTAGAFEVLITDANGCEYTSGIQLNDPATSTITATVSDVTCNGASDGGIALTVAGGTTPITFSLNGDTPQSSPDFAELGAGQYMILVEEGNGCQTSLSVQIQEPDMLGLTIASSDLTCFGADDGSIDLTASGGTAPYEYSLNGIDFQSSASFVDLAAGEYPVTVRDAQGCTTSLNTDLASPTQIVAAASVANASCEGLSDGAITIDVTSGDGPMAFILDGGSSSSTNVFDGLSPGEYTVTVEDFSGCTIDLAAIAVGVNTVINSELTVTDLSCFQSGDGSIAIVASGGNAPYEFSLDGTTFQSNARFEDLAMGSYTITTRDAGGCSTSTTTTLGEPDLLSLTVNQSLRDFTLTATGGTEPYTYSADRVNFQTTNLFTDLAPGAYTFSVRDVNECEATSSAFEVVLGVRNTEVSIYPNPVANHLQIDGVAFDEVVLIDLKGVEVLRSNAPTLSLQHLLHGMHIIRLIKDKKIIHEQRIMIN